MNTENCPATLGAVLVYSDEDVSELHFNSTFDLVLRRCPHRFPAASVCKKPLA